jgi:bacteriocin-like protein
MESEKIEVRPLTEHELDAISGGLDCDITPPRMEASMQVGGATLVIWATAGCHGTYWK